MGINGKAGHGRGNRRRPFRRRENENSASQKGFFAEGDLNRPVNGRRREADEPGRVARAGENHHNRNISHKKGSERHDRPPNIERPKWTPPKINTEPLPAADCPWCGKPIRDISSAISDKDTGSPVHFDCVVSRISFSEKLEKGESITYIGGGRFGILSFSNSAHHNKEPQAKPLENSTLAGRQDQERRTSSPLQSANAFTIRKVIEWEDKDKRAEWRSVICDHYSVT